MNTQEMIETIRSNYPPENYSMLREALDHCLALLEAEAEGRLLVLPCKVGDTVYAIKNREIYATAVIGFRVHEWTGLWVLLLFDERKTNGSYELRIDDFGKTVFLTREEAEAALKEGAE